MVLLLAALLVQRLTGLEWPWMNEELPIKDWRAPTSEASLSDMKSVWHAGSLPLTHKPTTE